MELRHLRYFAAVAEELNITKAAARLHVSQPPLSRQIRDLEDELGVVLLKRSPKAVELTEAGKLFYKETKTILAHVDVATEKVRSLVQRGETELRVGYAPSPTADFLPKVLRELKRTLPKARINLFDLSSGEMVAGLRKGELDLALMVEQPVRTMRGLQFERLRSFPVGVLVAAGHEFFRKKSVSTQEVLGQPLVGYSRKDYPEYYDWVAGMLTGGKRRVEFATEADGATSLITAVESERGIAITADTYKTLGGKRVKFIPLSPAPESLALGLARLKGLPSNLAQKFMETVRKVVV